MSPIPGDDAERLYVLTRSDLSAGYQATQAAHAVATFCVYHPVAAQNWKDAGGWLITLATSDADELETLTAGLTSAGFSSVSFREADLADELTAVAFFPTAGLRERLSALPLALGQLDAAADAAAKHRERTLREECRVG